VGVGGTTALGPPLLKDLGGGEWKVRALLPDGAADPALEGVEVQPFAPFAPSALAKSVSDAEALVLLSEGACGAGGVEIKAMGRLMKAIGARTRRLVFVSSHGVERTGSLPFNLQNVFGQLDKQRAAEQEVLLRAKNQIPAVSILRLGKLREGSGEGVELAAGDALSGELSVGGAAETLYQTLIRSEAVNASFSAAPASGARAGDGSWDDEFVKLVGPELFRRRLGSSLGQRDEVDMSVWLRSWGRDLLRPGKGLTTPIQVVNTPGGVTLRFLSSGNEYDDFDEPQTADRKWEVAARQDSPSSARAKADGALRLVFESEPVPRVRVCRAEMVEGTIVKEMSEAAVLERLGRDLDALEKMWK